MPTATPSNYPQIEKAIANLISAKWPGMPVEVGDFSKIQQGTPCAVIAHGELHSPEEDRKPQFEWLQWYIPIHIFFDYTSDVEAHNLFRLFRADLIQLFQMHRYLDDGATPYPAGQGGQAIDCKIVRGARPQYFTLDGKDYVQSAYELWVLEKVYVQYP